MTTKKDAWRDNKFKTKEVRYAIKEVLNKYHVKEPDAEYMLEIVKNSVTINNESDYSKQYNP